MYLSNLLCAAFHLSSMQSWRSRWEGLRAELLLNCEVCQSCLIAVLALSKTNLRNSASLDLIAIDDSIPS